MIIFINNLSIDLSDDKKTEEAITAQSGDIPVQDSEKVEKKETIHIKVCLCFLFH